MSRNPLRRRSAQLRFESLEDRTTPTLSSPDIRYSFSGPSFADNAQPFAAPAAPAIAAGKGYSVEVTSGQILINTLPSGAGAQNSLKNFFSSLSPASDVVWSSSRITYDQYTDRFVIAVIANRPSTTFSNVYLAVSSSGNPTAAWHFAAVNTDIEIPSGTHTYANYLGLSVDEEAVYLTTSQDTTGDVYKDVRLFIVDKTGGAGGGIYNGGTLSVNGPLDPKSGGPADLYEGLVPAQMYNTPTAPGSSVGTYLVAYSGFASTITPGAEVVQIVRVDNPLTSPTFHPTTVEVGDIDDTSTPLNAPQPNSTTDGFSLDIGPRRAGNAVWRNNLLYFGASVNSPSGAEAGQDAAHWFQIDTTATPTVAQQGDIGGESSAAGLWTYLPTVAVDALGDLAVGYSGSNNSNGPSAYEVARTISDASNTMRDPVALATSSTEYVRHLLDSGGNPTGPNAWGPFSATVIAADDRSFWTFNAVSTGTSGTAPEVGRWVTSAGGFSFNWPPDIAGQIPNQNATEDDAPLHVGLNLYFSDRETAVTDLSYSIVGNTNPGMVTPTVVNQQDLTLTLVPNGNGSATITVQATDTGTADATPASTTQTFTLTVAPVNDPPVANPDSYSTDEDTTLNADNSSIPGVLSNDTDPDAGDFPQAVLNTGPSFASDFSLQPDGTFTYTPAPNFNGTDSFTYHAQDSHGANSAPTTVTIDVISVNDPPVAFNDTYTTAEDTSIIGATPSVLANDVDVDNSLASLTAILVTGPSHASSFTLHEDGTFDYTPDPDYNQVLGGTDSFTYKAFDGTDQSATAATVTIHVTPVDDAPRPADDAYSVNEDSSLTVDAAHGVLANDVEVDGETLSITRNTTTSHGTLNFNTADGSFTYTPNALYDGPDSFTYFVTDGHTEVGPVNVSITVTPINHAPVAKADAYAINEDTLLTVNAPGVLSNDTDVDVPTTLTAVLVTGPAHASTFGLNSDGSFTYQGAQDYYGADSFTYQAFDGTDSSSTVTVKLTVYPVQDPVVAVPDSAVTVGKAVKIYVLANDIDPDNDPLSVKSYTAPAHGKVTRSGTALIYTPTKGASGPDSFNYTVSDGHGHTDTTSVSISNTDVVPPTVQSVRLYYGTTRYVDLGSLSRSILPWGGITKVSVVFSEGIQSGPLASALTLTGIGGGLATTFDGFDAATRTATWTLGAPIDIDRVQLHIAASAVLDLTGNAMVRDWGKTFGVLPGDYNGDGVVNDTDLKAIKKKIGKIDIYADIDGTGIVSQTDLDQATANKGKRLR